jgi:hypothetical protein
VRVLSALLSLKTMRGIVFHLSLRHSSRLLPAVLYLSACVCCHSVRDIYSGALLHVLVITPILMQRTLLKASDMYLISSTCAPAMIYRPQMRADRCTTASPLHGATRYILYVCLLQRLLTAFLIKFRDL